ncbi:MAG: YifB family Mg chelatase-like AAA ATPase [Gammaproteobacteria bacterium]|nr:YifB family Mg chelatase-like AAA ATPase [Gammaproteobacteria bacterium]NNF61754.1 YifB family Mg chelatase-like AAA ATPase [Gammaproteobacteria bacterium]NNM21514.1 YifB family Mg chelatase-like AAA ATPase [Gammaproteobacteria bacterium]
MFANVLSRAQLGLQAPLVHVEAHIGGGLPRFAIVGLAETTVKESRDRVRAAIRNAGFEFPRGRIIVNLAPADVPKEGGRFDLPIALGILAASRQLRVDDAVWQQHEFYGELGLDGSVRCFRGALPVALAARGDGRTLVVPRDNCAEVAVVSDSRVVAVDQLPAIVAHLAGSVRLPLQPAGAKRSRQHQPADLADVRGQHHARRALEIAAAGGHSLLLTGPPGTGKSMLAMRLPGILPQMSEDEALETAAIHSLSSRGFDAGEWRTRPFRAPHHTASAVALVGGGSIPRPGEISLAHNGVLFLDELPEFQRHVLEVLRQPIETGCITISRAARQAQFPCRFQLVAAMNPCPCGNLGDPEQMCNCGRARVQRYRERVSGPLLDRIDLRLDVVRVDRRLLRPGAEAGESSSEVCDRVIAARERQRKRGPCNAALLPGDIDKYCRPDPGALRLLEQAMRRYSLSARAHARILRVARTIADLAGSADISSDIIAEAVSYRLSGANEKPRAVPHASRADKSPTR